MKNKTAHILRSALTLLLCISMFVGSTFAWFTDSVTTKGNIIQSGTLNLEMYWTDDVESDEWHNVETDGNNTVFDYENWEPGYTEVRYIKLKNTGNLAFNYNLAITPEGAVGKLAEVIQVYCATNGEAVESFEDLEEMGSIGLLETVLNGGATVDGTLLPATQYSPFNPSDEVIITLAMSMITTAGNEYQAEDAGKFSITALATQCSYESDSFGADYDENSEYPAILRPNFASTTVNNVNDKVAETVTMAGEHVSATVPAGVVLESGVQSLSLQVTPLEKTTTDITVVDNEILIPIDVHVEGVAEDNTVPIIVELGEVLPKYLNMGNYILYHVEDGVNNAMTLIDAATDFTAHNQYKYNPLTGEVTVAMATFSEVALVADVVNAWDGNYDYVFEGTGTEENPYLIATADELAGLGQIVGGMNGQTQNSFKGVYFDLLSDINIGDKNGENENLIFHPIGYYYNGDSSAPSSTVYSFEGIFDGNGHTITGIYQNTWEIKGDYDANYYKDGMGLFGYVVNGTVKNLTVDNFSSDGEFTPTGVIAAYAVNSTFENIAITNCNPRVYNTGNGGIIGIAGRENEAVEAITLRNITVDNSNKISALWGSWDVACGGLVGMYRGNVDGSGNATGDTIHFENCHVSAQIDVYNDVCANYQYYAYRYAGMIIGSVRHNTTNDDGKTIPNMKGISATGCTVNYGDWNDYYYCEFVKNSPASYSEDYQFSRVDKSEIIFDEAGNITGCTHTHTAEEDKTAVYLPFHQLFTGYSWGVSSIGLEQYSGIVTDLGITEGDQEESVVKFESLITANDAIMVNTAIPVGKLFAAIDGAVINDSAVQVAVSALNASGITATYEANTSNWEDGTITFNKVDGLCSLTIQDYNFCRPTTVILKDGALHSVFKTKFDGNFLYRVGNQNEITLENLFAENGVEIHDANVKVSVSGMDSTYVGDTSDWTKGTIKFAGTGVATVTIQDDTYCNVTELKLEVIDALNATTATNATTENVVLLKDCGFSSLEVSGGYALYGNGFTMTCASDSYAADFGYAFVTLSDGTLDNVQIDCPNFDYAALYKSNLTSNDNRSYTDATGKTRYYNARSGVMVSGNSQILNSRISGARAAVNVTSGNVVIDNSRIELGAVASVLVGSPNSLTLRDVTLVQKPTASTYDASKSLMGFSVLTVCDSEGNSAPITLEGTLIQNAWVDEQDKQYVPSAGQSIVANAMAQTDYLHDLDGDGTNESLNLGFAYMPESLSSTVNATTINDNRANAGAVPYDYAEVGILNGSTYVYSYKNTKGTDSSIKNVGGYTPSEYSDIVTVTYSDTTEGLTTGKSFGTDGWIYELYVDLDTASSYAVDFSKLSMSVNGVTVTDFTVDGATKPSSPVAVVTGATTYILKAVLNEKEYTVIYKVTGTETSKDAPSVVASNYATCILVGEKGTDTTWSAAAPALDGIQIKYWSVAEKQYKTVKLSDYTPTTEGQQNGTNASWTYTAANNDFTLTITNTTAVHSGNGVYAMPVVTDSKLYFVITSSNGLVSTSSGSRTITLKYVFEDNNGGMYEFSNTFTASYDSSETLYDYSEFCSGTLTEAKTELDNIGGCFTEGTLITLADGTQKPIEKVTYEDDLLAWDFNTGKYATTVPSLIESHETGLYRVINLHFADGTTVGVVVDHGFFNQEENTFVYIDEDNVDSYVGSHFVKMTEDGSYESVKLIGYDVAIEKVSYYTIQTAIYNNCIAGRMFTLTSPPDVLENEGWFDYFEIGEDMKYDEASMKADIAKYGLYTYEDFAEYVTYEQFIAFNGPYLKVLVGRGVVTFENIINLINTYVN